MEDRDRDRRRHEEPAGSRRSSGHGGSRRPRSPSRPPAHATTPKALPAVGPPQGVTAPRYRGPPPPANAAVAAVATATESGGSRRHGRGEKREEHGRGAEEHRRRKRHRTSPALKEATREPAAAAAGPSSSEDSSSSESNDDKKVDKKPLEDEQSQIQIIASRVDDLTAKAMAFSRALTRAQQALKTSSRIAREAAVSFESELENFVAAQRDINSTFNIDG